MCHTAIRLYETENLVEGVKRLLGMKDTPLLVSGLAAEVFFVLGT